jgi:hypothetical protein
MGITQDLFFELGSMQLEALLYFNLFEQAKRDQSPTVVSSVKDLGNELGLRSIIKRHDEGGPPNPIHLGLVDWLLKKISGIARAMHELVLKLLPRLLSAIGEHLKAELTFSVGVVLSFPPGITFNFEPAKLGIDAAGLVRTMIDSFYEAQTLNVP